MTLFIITSSVWKPSNSTQNVSDLSSSQVKTEDWISSDMDPSKSKGTLCLKVFIYICICVFPSSSTIVLIIYSL